MLSSPPLAALMLLSALSAHASPAVAGGAAAAASSTAVGRSSRYDVVVYDATSGGVIAAVASARHNATTALLCASWPACFPEGGHIIGGMSGGGLGQTDIGQHTEIIGGFAREFYERNRRHYGATTASAKVEPGNCRLPSPGCNATYNLEPHVAQGIFKAMLSEAGVDVFFGAQVESVAKRGSTITAITLTDGSVYQAKVFIDAGYEGDLFSRAGASYIVGRESRATYNESLAGRAVGPASNQFDLAVDPFDAQGRCLSPPPVRTPPPPLSCRARMGVSCSDGSKSVSGRSRS
jgi:2-polyprenyl-6-methoxyphenol hydroxylase-like FAD-dependent oxidoreductase